MIVELEEAKRHLNKQDSSDDDELESFIRAATHIVEEHAGPVLPKTFIERYTDGQRIWLYETPVVEVVAFRSWLSDEDVHDPDELVVDKQTGKVERADGLAFTGGPFRVEYEAGRDEVSDNIKKAALIIIQHNWETQRGGTARNFPVSRGIDSVPVSTAVAFAVPRRALEMLKPDMPVMRGVVVA